MNRVYRLLAFLSLLLSASAALGASQSAAALYNRANSLYSAGLYEQAIEFYLKAAGTGACDARLEYNLGNAYLKKPKREIGKAILHYRRASLLAPRDPDISYNLDFARSLAGNRLPLAETFYPAKLWNDMIAKVTLNELLATWTLAFNACLFCVIGYIIARKRRPKRLLKRFSMALGIVLIFTLPALATKFNHYNTDYYVVVHRGGLAARSGPGEDNPALFNLPEGTTVVENQCRGGWCQVATPGGLSGWVSADGVEPLFPDYCRIR